MIWHLVDGWVLLEYAWVNGVGWFTYEHGETREVRKLTRKQP